MKTISFWAKNNVVLTRWLIFFLCTWSNVMGLFLGLIIFSVLGLLNSIVLYLLLFSLFFLFLVYPFKSQNNFWKRKKYDFIIYLNCFCLAVCIGNQIPQKLDNDKTFEARTYLKIEAASMNFSLSSIPQNKKKETTHKAKKSTLRKKLRVKIREQIKKMRSRGGAGKAILVFLIILMAVGLTYLLAGLACSLSCSGSEAAALLLGIGGLVVIILLTSLLIRSVLGKKKKNKTEEEKVYNQ